MLTQKKTGIYLFEMIEITTGEFQTKRYERIQVYFKLYFSYIMRMFSSGATVMYFQLVDIPPLVYLE